MVEQRKSIRRGWNGRYLGFRMNCEQVPMLPARIVQWAWDDLRRIPYLLLWRGREGGWKYALRVARFGPDPGFSGGEAVLVQHTDGSTVRIYLAWRTQPRGGRSLLLRCWRCRRPSRGLYGFKVGNDGRYYQAVRANWECRRCAELRYSSEGGALLFQTGILRRLFGEASGPVSCPRPEVWHPYVFTDLDQAIDALHVQ
jgi:hypothetical protein